jgi:hypothetical protein
MPACNRTNSKHCAQSELYELAEAVRRCVVTLQYVLEVSTATWPTEQREFVFDQMKPQLPDVLEHVEALKIQLEQDI